MIHLRVSYNGPTRWLSVTNPQGVDMYDAGTGRINWEDWGRYERFSSYCDLEVIDRICNILVDIKIENYMDPASKIPEGYGPILIRHDEFDPHEFFYDATICDIGDTEVIDGDRTRLVATTDRSAWALGWCPPPDSAIQLGRKIAIGVREMYVVHASDVDASLYPVSSDPFENMIHLDRRAAYPHPRPKPVNRTTHPELPWIKISKLEMRIPRCEYPSDYVD